MSVHREGSKWRVRYREAGQNRSRSFDRKCDAERFNAEVARRRQLGGLASIDAGKATLDEYVTKTWVPTYTVTLAPKTRQNYAGLYDHHIAPDLGGLPLRELARSASRAGRPIASPAAPGRSLSVRRSTCSAASCSAVEAERLAINPVRLVRRAPLPRREEIQPLAPVTVERLRADASLRDATLISVLAYAGLRPSEALALGWSDVREKTLLVQRALSRGEEADTKTRHHRTVRLLAPLREDLDAWRTSAPTSALVFPGHDGRT